MKWPLYLRKQAQDILNEVHNDNVSPSKADALRFFDINPENIKIVILGQDPYPTPGAANGFAFAVNKGTRIPQSLNNIFKEIDKIYGNHEADETLEHWLKQGVLLLNTSLTVNHYQPNSHKKYWKQFTEELIKWMSENLELTWVLWGNEARKYKKIIKRGEIIEDAHPSPLSVRHRSECTFKILNFIKW